MTLHLARGDAAGMSSSTRREGHSAVVQMTGRRPSVYSQDKRQSFNARKVKIAPHGVNGPSKTTCFVNETRTSHDHTQIVMYVLQ